MKNSKKILINVMLLTVFSLFYLSYTQIVYASCPTDPNKVPDKCVIKHGMARIKSEDLNVEVESEFFFTTSAHKSLQGFTPSRITSVSTDEPTRKVPKVTIYDCLTDKFTIYTYENVLAQQSSGDDGKFLDNGFQVEASLTKGGRTTIYTRCKYSEHLSNSTPYNSKLTFIIDKNYWINHVKYTSKKELDLSDASLNIPDSICTTGIVNIDILTIINTLPQSSQYEIYDENNSQAVVATGNIGIGQSSISTSSTQPLKILNNEASLTLLITTPKGCKITKNMKTSINCPAPAIKITKTANKTQFYQGETITYTIIVENNGQAALTNIQVVDTMLGLNETISSLNSGEAKTYVLTKDTTSVAIGPLINNVDASTTYGSTPISSSSSVTVNIIKTPDTSIPNTPIPNTSSLTVLKTASPTNPLPGEKVTYTFVVTNTGNSALTNVSINDSRLDPRTLTPASVATLASGAKATFTGVMTVPNNALANSVITNIAYATVNGVNTGNPASATVIIKAPTVYIPIPYNPEPVVENVGDPFVYTNTTQVPQTPEVTEIKHDKPSKLIKSSKTKKNICDTSLKNAVINAQSYTIQVGEKFNIMNNVQARDNGGKGKDITDKVTTKGIINTFIPGKYSIVYEVIGGNCKKVSKTIIVTVAKPQSKIQ